MASLKVLKCGVCKKQAMCVRTVPPDDDSPVVNMCKVCLDDVFDMACSEAHPFGGSSNDTSALHEEDGEDEEAYRRQMMAEECERQMEAYEAEKAEKEKKA